MDGNEAFSRAIHPAHDSCSNFVGLELKFYALNCAVNSCSNEVQGNISEVYSRDKYNILILYLFYFHLHYARLGALELISEHSVNDMLLTL